MDSWSRWTALGIFLLLDAILPFTGQLTAQTHSAHGTLQARYEQAAAATRTAIDPSSSAGLRLIRFNGYALDAAGQPMVGVAGVTFAIYEEQSGGAPLWQETQNLNTDTNGRFNALLGANSATGVPVELFSGGDARWLAILAHSPGVSEQPRVLLVSVPYALRAADSDMLGGKPASAFMLTNSQGSNREGSAESGASPAAVSSSLTFAPHTVAPMIEAPGASVGYLPMFTDTAGDLANSAVVQSGNNIGIGTTKPGADTGMTGGLTINGTSATQLTVQNYGLTAFALNAGSGLWTMYDRYGGNWNLSITSRGGNLGVGTTTPSGKLDVTGKSNGFVVSGANLDPNGTFPLTFLKNSGTLLEGWNRSSGGGEIDLISNRGAGGTGGFAFYDYTNSGSLNPLVTFQGSGNVGIGTTTPDQMLTVAGTVHSTSGGFMFPDGSVMRTAATGTTQQPGGNLILEAGTGGVGNIDLQTSTSVANTVSDRLLIAGSPKTMTGPVPMANLFSVHIAAGDAAGGRVKFTIVASDGTNYAMETGEIIFLASPKQLTCAVVVSQYATAPPTYTNTVLAVPPIGQPGSLNAQCSSTTFSGDPGLMIFDTAPTSFTPTTHKVYYTIENQSQSALTLQP